MVSPNPSQRKRFRLLLDQGFPKPKFFKPKDVDHNLEVQHLSEWNPSMAENHTPDWVIYCAAAGDAIDALVTRDHSQTGLDVEMYTLSRLSNFHLVTFREGIDDPIAEWGQVIAYLPQIRKALEAKPPRVIILPKPTLGRQNLVAPKEYLEVIAQNTRRSAQEVRHAAINSIIEWENLIGQPGRYEDLLYAR